MEEIVGHSYVPAIKARITVMFGDEDVDPQIDFNTSGRDYADLLRDADSWLRHSAKLMSKRGDVLTVMSHKGVQACCYMGEEPLCLLPIDGSFREVIEQVCANLSEIIREHYIEPSEADKPGKEGNQPHLHIWERGIGHVHIRDFRPFRRPRRARGNQSRHL
jgi:hypothetical protein